MCCNHSSKDFVAYCRRHPGKLGWIISPQWWKTPREGIPFALDNGAFIAWKNGTEWDSKAWLKMLDKAARYSPIWSIVPDVHRDKKRTVDRWHTYRHEVTSRGMKTAFAVQDGTLLSDVPMNPSPDVIFIGGSPFWKWSTLPIWCKHFPRVHVGIVTTGRRLEIAERCGAESVDGTGFFRTSWNSKRSIQLRNFVEGYRDRTIEMQF